MNPRERYLETLLFGQPDRIPFTPGSPRESTLRAWHAQGLPADENWYGCLLESLGIGPDARTGNRGVGVDFCLIPQFEEKVLQRRQGHLIVQDWKGNICEISDQYDPTYLRYPKDFVTRRWIKCPVEGRDDWERMRTRYRPDAPDRFPDDFAARCAASADRDFLLTVAFSGPFWQLREWCGFEGLCVMMAEQPDFVAEMAAFWTEFVAALLERILRHVVPDAVCISEDVAYKGHSMISPAMTRRFLKPSYDRWGSLVKAAGVPIMDMDSDGYVGELIPIWIESGFNVCDPVEVAAHNDICEYRRRFGRRMAFRGGVDKRAMAKGGDTLRRELVRIEPVVGDGGYIPACDHGVPADVSWPNFLDYARRLAGMTGWL